MRVNIVNVALDTEPASKASLVIVVAIVGPISIKKKKLNIS